MAIYGYKISGFSDNARFCEAQEILDKKLKDWNKSSACFDEDGSVSIVYSKENEDGTQSEVKLVKNITESAVLVFSDIPIKIFSKGGILIYLRDLIPAAIFLAVYIIGYHYWIKLPLWNMYNLHELILPSLIFTFFCFMLSLITYKTLSKNRNPLRIRLIQTGWFVTPAVIIIISLRLFKYIPLLNVIRSLLQTPFPSAAIAFLICVYLDRRSDKFSYSLHK